jgi:hypothetical protein
MDIEDIDMLRILASFGVIRASVEFSGGGDSGEMGEVTVEGLVDAEKVPAPAEFQADLKGMCGSHRYNYTTQKTEPIEVYDIKHLLEAFAYNVVERTGVDWCNNEGGGGTLYIEPGTGKIDLEMYYNVTEQVDCGHDYSIVVPWNHHKEEETDGGSVSPFPVVSEEVGWGS